MFRHTTMHRLLPLGLALALAVTGCVDDIAAPPPPPTDAELVHYWHFNALPEGTIPSVPADYSKLTGAVITYPGTGAGYMDRTDGSDINLQRGEAPGFAIRPRNPSNTREFIIAAPSTGHHSLVVSFAVMRTANGAPTEEFFYSADGGANWTRVGAAYSIDLDFKLVTFDLKEVTALNDNANLRFRIMFTGDGAAGSSGNNRIDNNHHRGRAPQLNAGTAQYRHRARIRHGSAPGENACLQPAAGAQNRDGSTDESGKDGDR